jgi:DNA-binding transcriptional LysR family regulator
MNRMDLPQLDLNLLVALERLLARSSVTAAARDLGLSQPAASRALGRLREALGDPLLVQVGHRLVPTERALALVEPVAAALDAARRVFAPPETFDPATAGGTLVVALGDELQHTVGAAIASAVWARSPGVDLRFSRLSAATVEEGRRGQVDLAIAPDLGPLPRTAGAVDLAELVVRPLYRRRFRVAARAGRWSAAPDLPTFLRTPQVIVSFEAGGRGFIDDLLEPLGHRRRVAACVTTFPAALEMIRQTDLIGVLPDDVAARWPGIELHPAPIAVPEIPVGLMWHPWLTTDARHRFFRELVAGAVTPAGDCEAAAG